MWTWFILVVLWTNVYQVTSACGSLWWGNHIDDNTDIVTDNEILFWEHTHSKVLERKKISKRSVTLIFEVELTRFKILTQTIIISDISQWRQFHACYPGNEDNTIQSLQSNPCGR
jgi:hypothetical protein